MKKRSFKALVFALIAALLIFIPLTAAPQTVDAAEKVESGYDRVKPSATVSGGGTSNDSKNLFSVKITPEYRQSTARSMCPVLNKWRAGNNWYYSNNNTKLYVSGLKALKYDYTLEQYAMQRAAEIAISFEHKRPRGDSKHGLSGYMGVGENIAATTNVKGSTVDYGMAMFKEEDKPYSGQGHRRMMLSVPAAFDAVGVACVYYKGCYYWVQEFGVTSKPNTTPTTAVNGNKTMKVDIDSSLVKSVNIDWSKFNNLTMDQGKTEYLPEVGLRIGMEETWPHVQADVTAIPSWTSSKTSVATVDSQKGMITGVGGGDSKITATVNVPSKKKETQTRTVSVRSKTTTVKSVSLNKKKTGIHVNKTEKLVATVTSEPKTNNGVTWSSSNTGIATVDKNGLVKGIKRGKAVITATSKDDKTKKATCEVQVLFDDVPVGAKYYDQIYWASNNGITNGSSGNRFSPVGTATREEAVTFIYNYAGKPKVGAKTAIKDISSCSSWGINAVKFAKEKNLTTRSDNKFLPKNSCTRAEMVTFLWRLAGKPAPATKKNPFSDVKESAYYYKAVLWAKEKKVTSATTKFNPGGKVSRRDAIIFIYNYNKTVGKKYAF